MGGSFQRAGLWRRSIAFAIDIFTVSVVVSLSGVWLAGATGGSVRIGEVVGGRLHCTVGRATPPEFELPANTTVDTVARCTKELLGVPYDWSLIIRSQIQKNVGDSSAQVITVPIGPTGRVTETIYLDSLVIFVFGAYAFLSEWWFGATLGKRILGIRVRSCSGGPIDYRNSAKRAMMRMVAFVPSMAVAAYATGSPKFAEWLLEHPAGKIIAEVIIALWSIAFAVNFIVATTRRALPWHDRWAGTEAVLNRNDPKSRDVEDLPARSPVPSWLVTGQQSQ